jgi:hypothetical protein
MISTEVKRTYIILRPGLVFTCCAQFVRRVWRYQRRSQNQYIEEEETTQWPKEKVQRSTKHT